MFSGPSHPLLVKPNTIDPSVMARYVRINPVQWYGKPCLRMELYRCSLRNGKEIYHGYLWIACPLVDDGAKRKAGRKRARRGKANPPPPHPARPLNSRPVSFKPFQPEPVHRLFMDNEAT